VLEAWRLSPLEISKSISLVWLRCLLVLLHIDHYLLHGLEHLSLHHEYLLYGWWRWVSSIAILTIIVVAGPSHLKKWFD
jgi:hypothetical protein